MAPLVHLPVRQALTLPDLHDKTSESWADMVDDIVCSTPSPWADSNQPDFMLSAIPSSLGELDPKGERADLLAYPWASEPMQMQPKGIALDIVSVQYMYLSPQCLSLQHGLAQMCLAVEKPDVNQNSWYATDDVQVEASGDWGIGTTATPLGERNFNSERIEVSSSGHHAVEADQRATESVDLEQHNAGQCKPCAWFWKKQGCRNEDSCNYCHLCPEGELRLRKKARLVALKSATVE